MEDITFSTDKASSSQDVYASLQGSDTNEGPVIMAAGLQDHSRLSLLLEKALLLSQSFRSEKVLKYTPAPDLGWGMELPSPLLRPIERHRLHNVRLPLRYGADPNGVILETQTQLARIHRRFTARPDPHPASLPNPITVGEVGTVALQFIPLTQIELKERCNTVCQFWVEPHRDGIDYSSESAQLYSVVRASASTPEILDLLLDGGIDPNGRNADASFWKDPATLTVLPEEGELAPSSLAISTPLHSTIAFDNMDMLRGLLDRGINPNVRALISGSLALTAAQYAVLIGSHDAYRIFKDQPTVDVGARTPVFGVHILHFAVAHLLEDALNTIGQPLLGASSTALGHTLLHIACLPYRDEEIAYTPKVQESIHETRGLHNTQFR